MLFGDLRALHPNLLVCARFLWTCAQTVFLRALPALEHDIFRLLCEHSWLLRF